MRKAVSNRKRGIGSIIGGVYLVLIFITLITSFVFINSLNRSREEKYLQRIEFDNRKVKEGLEFVRVNKKADSSLNITVKNIGGTTSEVVYIGLVNEMEPIQRDNYHRLDLFLNPMEIELDIALDKIVVRENDTLKLMLLTRYGNIFYYLYSEKQDNGTGESGTYYDLSISISGSGETSPNPGNYRYLENTELDVSATTDMGWEFKYWILDGAVAGSQNPIMVSMDSDHDLEAIFSDGSIQLILVEDFFNNLDDWVSTGWGVETDQWRSASSSVKSTGNHLKTLQSELLDTSIANSINVSFWYRLSGGVDPNDVSISLYDESGSLTIIDYLEGEENSWLYYNYTTNDPRYFIEDFYILFTSDLRGLEQVWIDDLIVSIII